MRNLFNEIANNVVKNIINEADFKIGDSLVIPGSESMGRKIIRLKYGMNPDDFEYIGNGKFVYKVKQKKTNPRTKKPKFRSQDLGRKDGETEQEYLERVREINPKFAEVEGEIPGEEWRPIVNKGRYFSGDTDYTKSYEVSNMGRIRIIDFEDPMRSRISSGYDAPGKNARNFHLDLPGFKTTPPIHTLVADAWLPEPEGGIENYDVEHIDGNYHNNRADNLRYVLRKGRRGRKANAEIPTETPFAESIRRMIKESVRRALNEVWVKQDEIRNTEKTFIINDKEYTIPEVACLVAVARNCDKNNVCHINSACNSTTFDRFEFANILNNAFSKFGINVDFCTIEDGWAYLENFQLNSEIIRELKTLEHLIN